MGKVSLSCALCALCSLYGCSTKDSGGTAAQPLPTVGAAGGAAMLPTGGSAPTVPGSMMNPGTTPADPSAMPNDPAAMPQDPGADAAAPSEPADAMPAEPGLTWEVLISADWELAPNEETTYCQRVTLTEDVYFMGIRALNPFGTHHTATTVASPPLSTPDGLTRGCGSALSPQGIFGTGVGTDTVIYPPGVGMRLRAGQQVLLNLHVYNTSNEPLTGTSGNEVVMTSTDQIEHVAESLLAGPPFFNLPAGTETVVTGQCTVNAPNTLFAVQPHMHQLGVHMKGVAQTAAHGEVLLHDGPFDFENQVIVPIEPLEMQVGDVVQVECTFDNTTDLSVGFGESSTTEMCFLVLHRYPASDATAVVCAF